MAGLAPVRTTRKRWLGFLPIFWVEGFMRQKMKVEEETASCLLEFEMWDGPARRSSGTWLLPGRPCAASWAGSVYGYGITDEEVSSPCAVREGFPGEVTLCAITWKGSGALPSSCIGNVTLGPT